MEERNRVRRQQNRTYLLIISFALLVAVGLYYFVFSGEKKDSNRTEGVVNLPAKDLDTNKIILSRVEKQNQNMDSKIHFLESVVLDAKKKEEEQIREHADLKVQIKSLKRKVEDLTNKQQDAIIQQKETPLSGDPFSEHQETLYRSKPMLQILVSDQKENKLMNVKHFIPSGTTVKAVLVSSVDVNCSTFSASDPQPVKLRILDDGHLSRSVDVDLKGGIVIASAYGDISSERAYIRLERLTQVNPNGDFVETEVAGFVSGEDGKYGVKGNVIDRSEKQVQNAALSGFFSGMNQLAQSALNAKYYCEKEDRDSKDFDPAIFGQAAINGGSSAFDRLSEYYIKRSEQIRPVIQVGAGRVVDITFTHAVGVGDLNVKKKIESLREKRKK